MAVTTSVSSTVAGANSHGVTRVPISALVSSDSPRLDGENLAHIQVLAEIGEKLPPILVHSRTMRVIDGMHRIRAAVLRGEDSIEVEFLDGDETDVFVRAVEVNVTHGLPLSLRDRKAAASRIATARPDWADRAIARIVGLSPKTVAAVRRSSSEESPHSNTRVGLDGRTRPLDASEGRRAAERVIKNRPDASLREIAKSAGVSISTAHDVRQRIERGDEPAPSQQRNKVNGPRSGGQHSQVPECANKDTSWSELASTVPKLMNDPSLKLTVSGRVLLRLLAAHEIGPEGWERLSDAIPSHCVRIIGDLAAKYAKAWESLEAELKKRRSNMV